MPRIAVIDLGTNTFNLLIADVFSDRFEVLCTEKEGVALGMGGINHGKIAPDAMLRGIDCLIKFNETCNFHGAEKIRAIGTSALRDATNSKEFTSAVYGKTGIRIEIISGQQEAELIFKGVSWSYFFDQPAMIMDIGGGSTEFIFADQSGITEKQSFDIGVSRIFQELTLNDPYSREDAEQIERWLDEKTGHFFDDKSCKILIGASGSFETFYEMIHAKKYTETLKASKFPKTALLDTINQLIYSTQEERDLHPHIIPIRRKMIPIAAVKTRWVMNKLGIETTFLTPCSLKEGVLKE